MYIIKTVTLPSGLSVKVNGTLWRVYTGKDTYIKQLSGQLCFTDPNQFEHIIGIVITTRAKKSTYKLAHDKSRNVPEKPVVLKRIKEEKYTAWEDLIKDYPSIDVIINLL